MPTSYSKCSARRARGGNLIKDQQSDRAHKPGLPHAPRKGGDAEERRKTCGGEGLDVLRQAEHAQRDRRAGKRQQDHADQPKLVPGLQEQIMRVLSRRMRKDQSLSTVEGCFRLQCMC